MTGFETWLAGMAAIAVGALALAYKLTQKKP